MSKERSSIEIADEICRDLEVTFRSLIEEDTRRSEVASTGHSSHAFRNRESGVCVPMDQLSEDERANTLNSRNSTL